MNQYLKCTAVFAAAIMLAGCVKISEVSSPAKQESSRITEETTAAAETTTLAQTETTAASGGLLHAPEELCMTDTDGTGTHYQFTYDGRTFDAVYTPDNWKIVDSWQITDRSDMVLICAALREIHPIHGADMVSFRDAEDMAYEWEQHNLAYQMLSDDSPWKNNAKDVDINPADQGKSVFELYRDRLGA